jgi:hypothetical protein
MLPDGSCALSRVDHEVGTITPVPQPLPPLAAQRIELADAATPRMPLAIAPSLHPPPRFLVLRSLRI